jgi:hypothetical protein
MAFLLARAVIFCNDSPLVPQRFAKESPNLAWLIILLFTFMVCSIFVILIEESSQG